MSTTANSLTEVARKLREEQFDAAIEGSSLIVKLPMSSSVAAQPSSTGTTLTPMFGKVGRTTAVVMTSLTTILLVALVTYSASSGIVKALVIAAMVGALLLDLRRWLITDKAMKRMKELLALHRS
jgi:hypothetical protein